MVLLGESSVNLMMLLHEYLRAVSLDLGSLLYLQVGR